jgi:hypothetical protein
MRAYTWTVAATALLGLLATTTPAGALGGMNTASLRGTSVQGTARQIQSITLALGGSNTASLQGTAAGDTRSNSAFQIKSVTLPSSNSSNPGVTSE